jgi:hypothetical protein
MMVSVGVMENIAVRINVFIRMPHRLRTATVASMFPMVRLGARRDSDDGAKADHQAKQFMHGLTHLTPHTKITPQTFLTKLKNIVNSATFAK